MESISGNLLLWILLHLIHHYGVFVAYFIYDWGYKCSVLHLIYWFPFFWAIKIDWGRVFLFFNRGKGFFAREKMKWFCSFHAWEHEITIFHFRSRKLYGCHTIWCRRDPSVYYVCFSQSCGIRNCEYTKYGICWEWLQD